MGRIMTRKVREGMPHFNAAALAELAKLEAHFNGDSVDLLVNNMLNAMDESTCRGVPIDISAIRAFRARAKTLGVE